MTHSFHFVKHLVVGSTKMILFMTLNSFVFSQVSLCIIRTVKNWFIQNIAMIKIPYPACITLNSVFPYSSWLGEAFRSHLLFLFLKKYILASLLTQDKQLSQLGEYAGHTKHFYSSLLSPESSWTNRAVMIAIFYTPAICILTQPL